MFVFLAKEHKCQQLLLLARVHALPTSFLESSLLISSEGFPSCASFNAGNACLGSTEGNASAAQNLLCLLRNGILCVLWLGLCHPPRRGARAPWAPLASQHICGSKRSWDAGAGRGGGGQVLDSSPFVFHRDLTAAPARGLFCMLTLASRVDGERLLSLDRVLV